MKMWKWHCWQLTREVFSWKRVQTETNAFIVLICSQTKMVFDTGELASENQGPISVRTLNVARWTMEFCLPIIPMILHFQSSTALTLVFSPLRERKTLKGPPLTSKVAQKLISLSLSTPLYKMDLLSTYLIHRGDVSPPCTGTDN